MGIYIGIGNTIGNKRSSRNWTPPNPYGLVVNVVSATQHDLSGSFTGTDQDGFKWEKSTDGVDFTVIGTTDASTKSFSNNSGLVSGDYNYYRFRAYKGNKYSEYSSVVLVPPVGVKISSANSSIQLADASNEFYFNNGSIDLPFSIILIAKSNNLTAINPTVSRGDANGCSYLARLNAANGKLELAIYGSDNMGNNVLYGQSASANDLAINNVVFTYDGSKAATGLKSYMNGAYYNLSGTKYGTYTNMNNRAGMKVGFEVVNNNPGNLDLYTLMICNKELSGSEVDEIQTMIGESDITNLTFYANIISIHGFNGNLTDVKGNHIGTSVAPSYIYKTPLTLPKTTKTTPQTQYEAFKLGWFLCYNMESYTGDEVNTLTDDTPAASTFAAPSTIDVAAWATKAASSGKINYAILTVSHNNGFSLYDHSTAIWGGSQINVGSGVIVPTYTTYDVGETTADKNIVTKFISSFNAVDIKPILYYCIGESRNWCGKLRPKSNYLMAAYQFNYYHTYVKDRLKELASLTPFAVWIDLPLYYPNYYLSDLYTAIKSVNENILVMMNHWNYRIKTNSDYMPFDGASTEELAKGAILSSDAWWGKTQSINGVTYPTVKELTGTSRVGKWFYSPTPAALRPLSEIQALYDYAKAASIPCCISMNVKLDGTLDNDQADLIAGITL